MDLNDLLPTFLDAAGTAYTADYELPGESLLTAHGKKDRSVQYVEHQRENKRWCCLMDHRYKFVHHYGEAEELFDLESDPWEQVNQLYGTPSAEALAARDRLRAKLLEYEARWGLPGICEGRRLPLLPPIRNQDLPETCFPADMVQDPGVPSPDACWMRS